MAQPEKTFRIGPLSASVFVNDSQNGPYRTVALQRRYKDGDQWKSSTTYRLGDLPSAIAVLQMALTHDAEREAGTGE